MNQKLVEVRGIGLDSENRCAHYDKPVDIIAIKMKCCGVYYACKDCHIALAGHDIILWPQSERDHKAILCGACRAELTIRTYMDSGDHCPVCQATFNPACRTHYHFYFEAAEDHPTTEASTT
jgi:uncharacterized CHY-type Zn-finger protein